jgi:hypothetical protein
VVCRYGAEHAEVCFGGVCLCYSVLGSGVSGVPEPLSSCTHLDGPGRRPWSSLYLNLLQQLANLLAQCLLILDLPLGHPLPEPLEDLSGDALGLAFFFLETGDDATQDLGDGGRFECTGKERGDEVDLFR